MSGSSESGFPIINTGESAKKPASVTRDDLKIDTRPKTPGSCYRDGEFLVVAGTAELNLLVDRCIKTNEEPSERRIITMRSRRGTVPFRVTVEYPISASWLNRRRLYFALAGMMTLLGILLILPFFMSGRASKWDWLLQYSSYAGVCLFCTGAALLFWLVQALPLFPSHEKGGYTWFLGAGRSFLDSLPPRPGTGA
jgi:hypothetical protein